MGFLASEAKSTCHNVSFIFNLGRSTASPNPPNCRSFLAFNTDAQKTWNIYCDIFTTFYRIPLSNKIKVN